MALWALLSFLIASFNGSTFALAIVELAERLGAPIGASRGLAVDPTERGPGWSLSAPRIAAVLVAAGVIAAGTGAWLLGGIEVRDQVSIVGHRAGAGQAPENTLAAVRQAIGDGVDWIEIDVQETADGEVVVVHDSDFMKLAGDRSRSGTGPWSRSAPSTWAAGSAPSSPASACRPCVRCSRWRAASQVS